MIDGINHITLSVQSLDESFHFYAEVLSFRPLMRNKKSAYFLVGELWFCIEEDPAVRTGELPEYTHLCFNVAAKDFEKTADKIRRSGAKIFKENISEGSSLYFLDPNGHKLEIHVGSWRSRLDVYRHDPETVFFD